MIRCTAAIIASFTMIPARIQAPAVIDGFESIDGWKATPSDGVSLEIGHDAGLHGKAMRLDFDFHGHGGYAVVHKDFDIALPANYEFSFAMDFDATSTTIAITPADELARLPRPALNRTFDKYYENFVARRVGKIKWENYTPYELRVVGTFIHLGQKGRAHELLDFFFRDQRPKEWHQWAEVVWRDSREPKFIGDMPHTWVGSDYIRSALDMFAYERESDSSFVIGAGVPERWVLQAPGVRIQSLSTHYGRLRYTMRATGGVVRIHIEGPRIPPGGFVIRSPLDRPIRSATFDGETIASNGKEVVIRRLPASLVFRC